MAIDWAAAKAKTEVVTPWLTLIGLIAGGAYTLWEYHNRQEAGRIATTMEYVSRYMTPPLSDHRAKLFNAWDTNEANILAALRNEAQLPPRDAIREFENTILGMVRRESLAPAVQEQLLFFEQLTQCVELGLCDGAVARSTLQLVAREFFRQLPVHLPLAKGVERTDDRCRSGAVGESRYIRKEHLLERMMALVVLL